MNQVDNNNTSISQGVDVKSNKMPIGMKIILVWFFFGLFTTILNVGNLAVSLQNASLFDISFATFQAFSSLFAAVVVIFYIAGIVLRRWRKPMLILMGFNLFIFLLSVVWFLSTPFTKLATTLNFELPVPPNLNPEQLESVYRGAKIIMAIPMAIGLIILVIIFLYIYKHKQYFQG